MLRESRDLICKQKGPYGAMLDHVSLQSKEGGCVKISFANPFALLHSAMATSAHLQKFFVDRLVDHPSTPYVPWSLILYSDEITPGNVLATHNKRTLQCMYFSVAELGPAALSHEACWL